MSIGYQQRTADELVDTLLEHGVELLVDVRLNPISRKPGFSKKSLTAALEAAGIAYRHERDLGNPQDNREGFRKGVGEAWNRYEQHLGNEAASALRRVIDDTRTTTIALLCLEQDPETCHRSAVTDALQRDLPDLEVVEV